MARIWKRFGGKFFEAEEDQAYKGQKWDGPELETELSKARFAWGEISFSASAEFEGAIESDEELRVADP